MIAKHEPRIIVVPWNFRGISGLALERALDMADDQTVIRVVHVAAPLAGPDNGMLYETTEKRKFRDLESQFRKQVAADERRERTRNVRFHVVYGYGGPEIARFAKRYGADLIVTASRERTGLSKLLFGGLAERVVRMADCPVLVCKQAQAMQPVTLNRVDAGSQQTAKTTKRMSELEHCQS